MFLRPDQLPRSASSVSFSSTVPSLSGAASVLQALEILADTASLDLAAPLPAPYNTATTVQEALVSLATGAATTSSNVVNVAQGSHGFSVGSQIRPTSSGWVSAQGNTISNATNVWTVTQVIDTNNFITVKQGRVNISSHGLGANNTLLYLSPSTPGGLTSTKPVGTTTLPLGFYLPVIFIEDSNNIHVLGKSVPEIDRVLALFQPSSDTTTAVSFPISPLAYSNREFSLEFQCSWVSNNAGSTLRSGPALSLTAGAISQVDLFCSNHDTTGNSFSKNSNLSDVFKYYDTLGTKVIGEALFKIRQQATSWVTRIDAVTYNTTTSFNGPVKSSSEGFFVSSATPSSVQVSIISLNVDDYFVLRSSSSDFVRLTWRGPA